MKRLLSIVLLFLLLPSLSGCAKGSEAAYFHSFENGETGTQIGVIRSKENKRLKVLTDMLGDCTTELGSPDLSEVAYLIEVVTHDSEGNITDPSLIYVWVREGEVWFSVDSKFSDMEFIHKSNAVTEKQLTALIEKLEKEYVGG